MILESFYIDYWIEKINEGEWFIIVMVEFDEESYTYLIQLLNEKYYRTEDVSELKLINHIYKQLKFKSESLLSAIPSK